MIKTYFVTGTDTSVGKTLVSCALLQAAKKIGYKPVGYKPVASGGKITHQGLCNDDALRLQANSCFNLPYNLVNPILFKEETSPHIISNKIGKPIEFSLMDDGLKKMQLLSKWVIIEGAGGWFTPLSLDKTYADWVIKHRFSVILVVAIKLGCISHALMTVKSILSEKLFLAGWVANEIKRDFFFKTDYISTLTYMIKSPCLGCIPYLESDRIKLFLGDYLNLSLLT